MDNILAGNINAFPVAILDLQDAVEKLDKRIAALEAHQIDERDWKMVEWRLDKQSEKINRLENNITKEPSKTVLSRAKKIERYLASRPDHKATFETLRGYLGVDKFALNRAISTLTESSPARFSITKTQGNKRKRTITMLMR